AEPALGGSRQLTNGFREPLDLPHQSPRLFIRAVAARLLHRQHINFVIHSGNERLLDSSFRSSPCHLPFPQDNAHSLPGVLKPIESLLTSQSEIFVAPSPSTRKHLRQLEFASRDVSSDEEPVGARRRAGLVRAHVRARLKCARITCPLRLAGTGG